MRAYAGPASNVRVVCTSRDCFSEGGALAELMSLFEKSEVNSPTIGNDKQMEINEEDNNLRGMEVLLAFITVLNGV